MNFDVISVLDFLILFSMKFEVIINKGDGSFHQNQTAVFEGSDFKIFKWRKWTSFKGSGFETLIHLGFTRKIVTWNIYSKYQVWSTFKTSKLDEIYFWKFHASRYHTSQNRPRQYLVEIGPSMIGPVWLAERDIIGLSHLPNIC